MNKSLVTNVVAGGIATAGYLSPVGGEVLKSVGLFALSGALTNWLAVHMLFERVPGLYGSGVIPTRFEEFKAGIRALILQEFFQTDTIDRLLASESSNGAIDLSPVIDVIDFDRMFAGLTDVVKESSFGGMLGMVGGEAALEPLRDPFRAKATALLGEIAAEPEVQSAVKSRLLGGDSSSLRTRVETLVDARLDELTPAMVKDIVQDMIRQHLGWLVVWGGFFGGLVGLVAAWLP